MVPRGLGNLGRVNFDLSLALFVYSVLVSWLTIVDSLFKIKQMEYLCFKKKKCWKVACLGNNTEE